MKLLFEIDGIMKCLYNENEKVTQHDWETFLLLPDDRVALHQGAEVFLNFIKDNKITKHIVNVKHCTDSLLQEDLDWLTTYFVPKEIEYGIKYIANIISDDVFTRLTSEEWQERLEHGLVVKDFGTVEEAYLWLVDK